MAPIGYLISYLNMAGNYRKIFARILDEPQELINLWTKVVLCLIIDSLKKTPAEG